ncbi:hypothetical protein BU200_03620 [Streptococcus acidominimus]|uniref:Uncharacterized protein n=1 Tax=Streptococcus acidominimus TaxID=1326 RepID=A0A1Q8EED8_STRAI|nr:hypothetical protein BU200_03620 [Streptococcus acidominimus]SUN07442.1 Uncharacterised protein [Streptococcus acidominimus]
MSTARFISHLPQSIPRLWEQLLDKIGGRTEAVRFVVRPPQRQLDWRISDNQMTTVMFSKFTQLFDYALSVSCSSSSITRCEAVKKPIEK